jgi:hypothetical protein
LDFDVVVDLEAVFIAAVFAAVLFAADFFLVVDVCGDGPPAHAPMARAANRATETGTTIGCKNPVYMTGRLKRRLNARRGSWWSERGAV